MSYFDRLELRLRRWAIPGLLKIVAFYQLLVWALLHFKEGLVSFLALDPVAILHGQVWRLFTFAFIPQNCGPILIIFVTWFLVWVGTSLENAWGAFRVNVYFALTMAGLVAGAFINPTLFVGRMRPESTLVYSAHFLAFATLFPNEQILLFFIIPVRVKWLGWAAALGLLAMFGQLPAARWAIFLSHLGYLIFLGPELWRGLRHRGRVGFRRRRFESEKLDTSEAFHRCSVCGKTDRTDPRLEFRVAADGEEYCVGCLPQ